MRPSAVTTSWAKPQRPASSSTLDQGEELYVRSEERERHQFSKLFAGGLADSRFMGLMSLRADFLGELQKDRSLYAAHQHVGVPPLGESELRDVVGRPAKLLSARFETDHLAADIARKAAEESAKDAGALPLLSYLLDDMWTKMVRSGDGVLRLPPAAIELGGILAERANTFLSKHPQSEGALRRILTLNLATVREDGEPTRRRALRSDFTDDEWRLISELADHPNRLLVTAATEGGDTYAEVAHEAIFRRWDKLREWIASEREFLAWKTGLESARRGWQIVPEHSQKDALLMGFPLTQAITWLGKRADEIPQADREFVGQSRMAAHRRKLRIQVAFGALAAVIILGFVGYWNEQSLRINYHWIAHVRSHVLTAQAERMLKPGETFRECVKTDANYSKYCPEMVVAPSGGFKMGSPITEEHREKNEGPQHEVTIARPFAVSRFEVTFDQWDACVQYGGCTRVRRGPFGGGKQPAININWYDAKEYAKWLSRLTGQQYRLLSEAEWEYAARAGTEGPYYFEVDSVGPLEQVRQIGEYAWYVESSGGQTHPIGGKKPNSFGLYDMYGNAAEWLEDCYHDSYQEAPSNGLAWVAGNCSWRVIRGGGYNSIPWAFRSASRTSAEPDWQFTSLGLRVARTLDR
jgi:formylglycine-generating enzyme required for sulfatase activity